MENEVVLTKNIFSVVLHIKLWINIPPILIISVLSNRLAPINLCKFMTCDGKPFERQIPKPAPKNMLFYCVKNIINVCVKKNY